MISNRITMHSTKIKRLMVCCFLSFNLSPQTVLGPYNHFKALIRLFIFIKMLQTPWPELKAKKSVAPSGFLWKGCFFFFPLAVSLEQSYSLKALFFLICACEHSYAHKLHNREEDLKTKSLYLF